MTIGKAFADGLINRHGFSFRSPHVKRRSTPNDWIVASFLAQMESVTEQFTPELIVNIDETCWRLINGRIKTLAKTGATEVTLTTPVDPKQISL